MRTLTNVRTRRSNYFHSHPLHGAFSLIASFGASWIGGDGNCVVGTLIDSICR